MMHRRSFVLQDCFALAAALVVQVARVAPQAAPAVRIAHGPTRSAVRRAVDAAHRLLQRPGCEQIFSDFADASGRLLSTVLEEQGHTGTSYLDRVLFYDGSQIARCRNTADTVAVTAPGSLVVFVCREGLRRHPDGTGPLVIHEMLHSLGLGENPPSSLEITRRVKQRCGG